MRDLGTLGGSLPVGGQRSNAFGINDSSQVVGTSVVPGGNSHAFLWDDSAGMTDLMTLAGADSTANHIDNLGQIVGASDTANGERHAFLWTQGGLVGGSTTGSSGNFFHEPIPLLAYGPTDGLWQERETR